MILFDFDGTLADSISLGIELINSYADKFGYKKVAPEKVKGLSARMLIKESHLSFWKLPYLVCFIRKRLEENSDKITKIGQIDILLAKLKDAGFTMGILTSNSFKNISYFLKKYNLESYFSYIRTDVSMFGKTKALKKAKRCINSSIIYVGDELRDIEACRKINIPVVSVSWGLNTFEVLNQANKNFVAKNIEEAFNLIVSLAHQYKPAHNEKD